MRRGRLCSFPIGVLHRSEGPELDLGFPTMAETQSLKRKIRPCKDARQPEEQLQPQPPVSARLRQVQVESGALLKQGKGFHGSELKLEKDTESMPQGRRALACLATTSTDTTSSDTHTPICNVHLLSASTRVGRTVRRAQSAQNRVCFACDEAETFSLSMSRMSGSP